jgi:hypothetical protein
MIHKKIAIGFASDLVPLVKDGSKVLTYRIGDKYNFLRVGDRIMTKDSGNNKVFGELEIVEVTKMLFKDLPINRSGHEIYSSKEEKKRVFEKYYPGEVNDDSEVLVLGFKLVRVLKLF